MSVPLTPLQNVAFFQEGPGVRKWQFRNEGIKLINVKNIVDGILNTENSDKYLDPEEVKDKYTHFLVDEGDLVMASSGATWGKTAWVESKHLPLCMNTSMIRFKSLNENVLNIKYLHYFLKTDAFTQQMDKLVTGSAQPNFGSSHLKQIEIPLPPLPEQQRIAAILDKADAIRRKRQQALQLADEFLRSVFLEMFGEMFNSVGYEKSLKKSISKLTSYIDYRGKTPVKSESGIPLITAKNVKKGYISENPREYIPEDNYEEWMTRGKPQENDILFTTEAPLGHVALLGKYQRVVVGQRLVALRSKGDIIPEYLMYALLDPFIQEVIYSLSSGSTAKGIRTKELYKIEIPLPPIELQREFARRVQKVEGLKAKLKASQTQAEAQFNALSQQAFAGEL